MKRKVATTLLSSVIAIALTLGVMEAASRLHLLPCFPNSPNVWEPNPDYGWFHRRGTSGWGQGCLTTGTDWRSYVEINDQGLRDDESHPYEKPDGVFRVLLLGDSFTEGFTVDLDDHFAPDLERRLTALAGRPVEVLNSGVSAWGNAQELLFYLTEGIRYSPDLVLLLFNPGNDIGENIPGLGGTDRRRSSKPWFSLEDGKLVLRDYPAKTTTRMPGSDNNALEDWLERRTHVYPMLHTLYQRLAPEQKSQPSPERKRGGNAAARKPAGSRGGAPASVPRPPFKAGASGPARAGGKRPEPRFAFALETLPPAWESAWQVTKEILLETRRQVESRGARFAVAVVPSKYSVRGHQDSWFDGNRSVKIDHRLPLMRTEEFLTTEHFDTCPLQPAFRARFEQTGQTGFHTWDVHWSPEGHALVATELETCLRNLELIPIAARE